MFDREAPEKEIGKEGKSASEKDQQALKIPVDYEAILQRIREQIYKIYPGETTGQDIEGKEIITLLNEIESEALRSMRLMAIKRVQNKETISAYERHQHIEFKAERNRDRQELLDKELALNRQNMENRKKGDHSKWGRPEMKRMWRKPLQKKEIKVVENPQEVAMRKYLGDMFAEAGIDFKATQQGLWKHI